MRGLRYIAILLIVSSFMFFFGLGKMALTDPDETFYAQTAKEMLQSGQWGTPLIFGKPQFEKPVLYYLLVRLSYMAFGINEFSARFPSAIFGILGILGVYLLGQALFSRRSGFLSALIMAASVGYLVLSRACVTDMVLTVFILYGFLFFLRGWTGKGKAWYAASSVMIALAVLTKGPVGVFIPFVVIVLYFTISRQWADVKKVPVASSVLIFLIIALPWYIVMMRLHGNALADEFFGLHNITRFLEPEHRHGTSPLFYIPVVLGGIFPWTFFLLFGTWYMYKYDNFVSRVKAHRLFLTLWFLTVFLFFSVARTKLVTYIFPLFPVLAIVAGRFWEMFIDEEGDIVRLKRYMNASYLFLAGTSVLALIGLYFFVRYEYPPASAGTLMSGAVFVLGILVSLAFFKRDKRTPALYSIVVTVLLLLVPLNWAVLPVIEGVESSKTLAFKFKELAEPGEPLGGECDHRRGVAFYTDRTDVVDVHPFQDLIDFVSRPERVWCIIQRKHYDQLKENRPELSSEVLFQSGKKVLFTNRVEE